MNNVGGQMPGYRINEYLLVLNPPEALQEKIQSVKKEFNQKFRPYGNSSGRPHLALIKFSTFEMMEEKIVHRLKVIGMGTSPFKIQLKDYGSFPSHTIFINVLSRLPIEALGKELKSAQRLMKSPDADPHFIQDQNFNIALKLNPAVYEKAWLEYSHRHFTGSFIADGMLLLKRRQGEMKYQIVQRFEFMNLPVSIKQAELFG